MNKDYKLLKLLNKLEQISIEYGEFLGWNESDNSNVSDDEYNKTCIEYEEDIEKIKQLILNYVKNKTKF